MGCAESHSQHTSPVGVDVGPSGAVTVPGSAWVPLSPLRWCQEWTARLGLGCGSCEILGVPEGWGPLSGAHSARRTEGASRAVNVSGASEG